jgi:hypothetical protein
MIKIEKEVSSDSSTYIPFFIVENKGVLSFEIYDNVYDSLKNITTYNNFFSKDFIDELDNILYPIVTEKGYYRECVGKYNWYNIFSVNSLKKLNLSRILPSSKLKISKKSDFLISDSFKSLIDNGYPYSVTEISGKIVSIASVNENMLSSNSYEITVETNIKYRHNGYAVSNVVNLARLLLSDSSTEIYYNCSRYNVKSNNLAKTAGFDKIGRFYAYTAYK